VGVDLMLLPIDHERDGWVFSHTVLSLDRASALWDRLRALADGPVPLSFGTYVCQEGSGSGEEPHYGNTQYDAYGARIMCAAVAALLPLAQHPRVQDSARNRAVWAYLGALPPQTRVALYWH
jgi:hypothetical protein